MDARFGPVARALTAIAAATFCIATLAVAAPDFGDPAKILRVAFVAAETGFDPQAAAYAPWILEAYRIENVLVYPWVEGYKYNAFNAQPWQYYDVNLNMPHKAVVQ